MLVVLQFGSELEWKMAGSVVLVSRAMANPLAVAANHPQLLSSVAVAGANSCSCCTSVRMVLQVASSSVESVSL